MICIYAEELAPRDLRSPAYVPLGADLSVGTALKIDGSDGDLRGHHRRDRSRCWTAGVASLMIYPTTITGASVNISSAVLLLLAFAGGSIGLLCYQAELHSVFPRRIGGFDGVGKPDPTPRQMVALASVLGGSMAIKGLPGSNWLLWSGFVVLVLTGYEVLRRLHNRSVGAFENYASDAQVRSVEANRL